MVQTKLVGFLFTTLKTLRLGITSDIQTVSVVELSGPSSPDKVFLKEVRWQRRASGVFEAKRLLKVSCASIREMPTLNPTLYGRQQRQGSRILVAEDDFEVEDAVDYEMDGAGEDDEDEGDLRDYETEYDMPMGEYTVQESETFISTEGVEEERIVDYKIDEDEFHKLSLYDYDFFIRKIPDQDDDVFDFREMYVTAPDTDTYAIPKVIGEMPKKPLRCMKRNYEYVSVTEPPVDTPRAPFSKTEYQAMKVLQRSPYECFHSEVTVLVRADRLVWYR